MGRPKPHEELAALDPQLARLIEAIDPKVVLGRLVDRDRDRFVALCPDHRRPAGLDGSGADHLGSGRGGVRWTADAGAAHRAGRGGAAAGMRAERPQGVLRDRDRRGDRRRGAAPRLVRRVSDDEVIEAVVAMSGIGQLERRDVPDVRPRPSRRLQRRRPRPPARDPDRLRARRDAARRRRRWRSPSAGARTARSPPSTSGRRCTPTPADRLSASGSSLPPLFNGQMTQMDAEAVVAATWVISTALFNGQMTQSGQVGSMTASAAPAST